MSVLLATQGWRDNDEADALRDDRAFRLAVSSAAGHRPLDRLHGPTSQPPLSRRDSSERSALRSAVNDSSARTLKVLTRH